MPVVDLEPGLLGAASRPGCTPAPTTTMSPSISFPLLVTTPFTSPSPSNAASSSPAVDLDPLRLSTSWNHRPASSPKRPRERHLLHHHDRALASPSASATRPPRSRCSCRRSSPPGQRPPPPRGSHPSCRRRAGSGCPPCSAPSTRRMFTLAPVARSALLEADLVPALQLRRPRLRIQRHDVGAGPQLDPVLLVPVDGIHVGVLALGLAPQVLLRERRALVRRLRLAPDQQDRAVGARFRSSEAQ